MSIAGILTVLVSVQTVAIVLVWLALRGERRRQAITRLSAVSWTLLDRFVNEWMRSWPDPAVEFQSGLEVERREFNQSVSAALRYFSREDLNIAFAVKQLIDAVESDRLLYLAKQKAAPEERVLDQANVHYGADTNPADLMAAVSRFREGIEELQELVGPGHQMRTLLSRLRGWRSGLPPIANRSLGENQGPDSIAPESP